MPGLRAQPERYKAVEAAILAALRPAGKPLAFDELVNGVRKLVSREMFPPGANLEWYTKSVQLGLEQKGRLEREEKPLRWKLPTGPKRVLRQNYTMKATREEVWRRLVDPTEIEGWSGASAVMEAWPGGRFELWGGDMFGVNLEVAPPRKLVQQWQVRGWEEPSTVTFTLRSNRAEGQTIVELVHAGVPAEEAEEYAQGWDEHYLGAIKRGLG